MRICCVQLPVPVFDRTVNYETAERAVRSACERADKPDLLLLPELWNVGYYPKEGLLGEADENGERTRALMGGLAAEYGVNVAAGTVVTAREGKVYNTAYAFDRTGAVVSRYDKVHRFAPLREDIRFAGGQQIRSFMLDGVRCGWVVCYDIRFPELARKLFLEGAELLLCPVQWPAGKEEPVRILAAARAIENGTYFLCANSTGRAFGRDYAGGTFALTYDGERIGMLGSEPGLLFADLDFDALRKQRSEFQMYEMRRPEVYL